MPADVVNKISGEIAKAVRQPDYAAKIRNQGAEPVGNTPAEFRDFIVKDQEKWRKTAATTGIKLD